MTLNNRVCKPPRFQNSQINETDDSRPRFRLPAFNLGPVERRGPSVGLKVEPRQNHGVDKCQVSSLDAETLGEC